MKLYNSLTRKKERFDPIDSSDIKMYVCGPTVYAAPHIGNLRSALVFDVLYRTLRHKYGEKSVDYMRNFTDFDDKIIAAAMERNTAPAFITQEATQKYLSDLDALNVLRPNHMPNASDYGHHMGKMIENLIESGHAYQVGEYVYFDTSTAESLKMSGHDVQKLRDGVRVDVDTNKRNPQDFVLWKPIDDGMLPYWESPWNDQGRPGWHVECSAMIDKWVKRTIDIHGGGMDLKFPHHEAEIMQSEACNGYELAKYWVHNGMITVDGQKMSKSAGNTLYLDDIVSQIAVNGPTEHEVIRWRMLMTHYRSPLDWTADSLEEARMSIMKIWRRLMGYDILNMSSVSYPEIEELLYDDMNTPAVLAELHSLMKADGNNAYFVFTHDKAAKLISALRLLGFNLENFNKKADDRNIDGLVAQMDNHRIYKNFEAADWIRKSLSEYGVEVQSFPISENKPSVWYWK